MVEVMEVEVVKPVLTATEIVGSPITLPCGLVLPHRFVKAPMQETLATLPAYDPPMKQFRELYGVWGKAQFGLIITGQVQVDIRFLSRPGDTVVSFNSLLEPTLSLWKEWATLAQKDGTPCIVQLAHPGRMSARGSGIREKGLESMCSSSVPVEMGGREGNRKAVAKIYGIPREMTIEDIDEVVGMFLVGAKVAFEAGFSGIQLHAAHGFLLSQFLSPYTNRRNDDYGGTPEKRLKLLQRLVTETRAACPAPFCLAVKLNSGDYMKEGGLTTDEALEQVRWLIECGMVDMIEISGGNAEGASQGTARLHRSFGWKSMAVAPIKSSTRIREALFTDFAERVQAINPPVTSKNHIPITLSGGFRSRLGMADAIDSGVCDLIGLGRAVVIQPSLPREILLNPNVGDEDAFAMSHQIQGLWLAAWLPVKIVGMGLPLRFFYHNMHRLGAGLSSDPHVSLPYIFITGTIKGMLDTVGLFVSVLFGGRK